MGAWADDASWKNNTMSPASYFALGSNTSAASNSKTIGDVSYTHSINMTSKSNQSSNKTNGYYIQFTVSSTSNFNIVFGANGGARTIRLNTGWTYDISTNATQIANGATPSGGIKATSSSVSNGQFGTLSGSDLPAGTYYICGSGSVSIYEISITSAGPVDPVFELSADEVEVGKTISVTGPDGLSFNAEPVSGTTGAVSVDGGTITGVTAGAAQVRVTSDATEGYNAYDHTFDITVTAAKIATELSFGTPTTTVARGEEVTNAATLTAGGEAISGTVTYSSDNESVATVDATGKVTGVKAGTANIKANFAGDATYSAAEEISYAITVTLPALTAVDNKFWTSASLLSEAGGAKDYTTADVLDNMEIVGTSTALRITTGGEKTIDGQTFGGRVRFGKDGTVEGNYLHFMVKPNTKITMWGIRATAGAESNGLALSIGAVGNEEEVYSFAGGDVEYMTYIYTGSEDADMYAYSKATAGASMMAIKVEPIQSTTINLNSKGFATYSSKYDFTFDGADAYGMKLSETSLVGTKVTSGQIKAGEGILFKGEANATVTITETTGAEAIDEAKNNLIGTTNASEDIISSSAAYKYALSGDTFLPFTGTQLQANKAFFGSDTAIANSLDMVFEDEATAINGVNANENLNVNVPVKVIKNGQLVIETANGVFTAAGAQVK